MNSNNCSVIKKYRIHFILICFALANLTGGFQAFGQKPLNPPKDLGPQSQVELLSTDSLNADEINHTRTFYRNVIFRHRGVLLGCQMAVQNTLTNVIEAYGKIIINQGDTLTITGDTLFYEGNTRLARIYGKSVVLRDKKVTLRTTKMNYNLNNSQVYYPVYGTIMQDSSKLSSNEGYYNSRTKLFKYYGDVEILNKDFLICTDSLDYDSNTKLAYFNSPTVIKSKDGDLKANRGTYNIKTKKSVFQGRAMVVNESYTLEADTLNFDNQTESGLALGNVVFHSFEDSVKILGNKGERFGDIGMTKIMGSAVVEQITGRDTLYMSADTLYAYELKDSLATAPKTGAKKNDKKKEIKDLIAKGNVKVFRNDFQSISDSLTYKVTDSMIVFTSDPVLWSKENQLEADTIRIYLKNNRLSSMKLFVNSFVVAVDTVRNFNQIKGRDIEALFDDQSALNLINVEGNGESIYFALDDKNKMIGLNRVECSKMRLRFRDRKVKQISFLGNPESKLIPPKEVGTNESKLDDFTWKIDQKPNKKMVLGSRSDYFNTQM